ncbi:deoxyhypusine synthase [archaeon]|nr:deoxyhypusine synthase [archaeon]
MHKNITHIDVNKKTTVDDLMHQMETTGFGAKKMADVTKILESAIKDKETKVFMGVAGALVPAGMRKILRDMINDGWVDVVVTTGANLTHDIIEAMGHHHLTGNENADDKELRDQKIDRIYDVFLKNEAYEDLETYLHKIYKDLPKKRMGVREFLYEIGKRIEDKNSILRTAADKNIPIFCPGISDSAMGFHAWSYILDNKLDVDVFEDMKELLAITWDSKNSSVFILGGGVPKDFILQAMQFSPKEHSSAVQITMDRPEHGGLSGAELKEAISWGKLGKNATHATLIADVTIALPLITASLKSRGL